MKPKFPLPIHHAVWRTENNPGSSQKLEHAWTEMLFVLCALTIAP